MTKKSSKEKTPNKAKAIAKPYERTEAEKAFMQDFQARKNAKPEVPKGALEITGTGKERTASLRFLHNDAELAQALIQDSFGTTDNGFADGLTKQISSSIKNHGPDALQQEFDFMISAVAGIEPRDQLEAMLAAQMAAVHVQMMTFARRLAHVDNIPQQDSAERAFNKLARTFTTQMEALKKYRTGGEQKMTVEHVHVHEGGQAIVGNVQGGRDK